MYVNRVELMADLGSCMTRSGERCLRCIDYDNLQSEDTNTDMLNRPIHIGYELNKEYQNIICVIKKKFL